MANKFLHLDNLTVTVDQVIFTPHVSDPPERPYGFVYFITIENNTPFTVQLLARKWIVREKNGEVTVVEGEGIVGEKPILETGESFQYNSCHVIGTEAKVEGSFFGVVEGKSKPFIANILPFELIPPS